MTYYPTQDAWQSIDAARRRPGCARSWPTPWLLPKPLKLPGPEIFPKDWLPEPPPANRPPGTRFWDPTKDRAGPNGLILRGGRIAAEWGDTSRPDMTFSIAKSYLSILTGVAVAREFDPRRGRSGTRVRSRRRLRHGHRTATSAGDTCCTRPASGKAPCGTSPIS